MQVSFILEGNSNPANLEVRQWHQFGGEFQPTSMNCLEQKLGQDLLDQLQKIQQLGKRVAVTSVRQWLREIARAEAARVNA